MAHLQYMPGDPRLVDQLVYELKSKGIFDQFRKDCIADVDTRPAYQNLRQRVENSVSTFLARQCWKPDLNKNQLREKLRKHILDGNYLEQGVERIVDQVVNPKIATVFIPQVEDLVYNYLGITRKKTTDTNEKTDLLPTDLEAVSPGSVKANDDKDDNMDIDEKSSETTELQNEKLKDEHNVDKKQETIEISSNDSETNEIAIVEKDGIPLPEDIKPETIPKPDDSPPGLGIILLDEIVLPKDLLPSDIPLPEDSKTQVFKPMLLHSEDSNSSSDSSLRRNMSPLTPIRNYNNENSYDAQQAFDNESENKTDDKKEPSSFRFAIESKEAKNEDKHEKKEVTQTPDLSYQFNNQVNINAFHTPMYEDSSNSNNLRIDYESDTNSKTVGKPEIEAEESKKEKKEDRKSHKSSHRSRDSHRHSSSKDKRSDSKQSSRDSSRHKKSSKDDKKSKDSDRPDKSDKKDSERRSSKSSHRDSKSHRSSSSSTHRSSKDDKKSSKDKSRDRSSKDRKDSKDSKSSKDKDKKKKTDEKEKKKDKKDTDDHYSSSGRGNHSRRSTDRDSNDGSSSSKGSHHQNGNKTTENKKETKSSSSKDTTSTSGDSTSPSDKDQKLQDNTKLSQFKPAVRVDNHLETPIAAPPRLPFVPDVTLKKPKFAANFEEAKKMMKLRKFLDEEQKRMNQEAALLLEFQANVRPSLSQVYSSIPGPELEFACGNVETETIENKAVVNETVENKAVVNETVENKPVVNKTVKSKAVVNKIAENKAVVNETVENKAVINKTVKNKAVVNNTVEYKAVVNKTVENKGIVNDIVENKAAVNETVENKAVINETVENTTFENKAVVNETVENKAVENKAVENDWDEIKAVENETVIIDSVENKTFENVLSVEEYKDENTEETLDKEMKEPKTLEQIYNIIGISPDQNEISSVTYDENKPFSQLVEEISKYSKASENKAKLDIDEKPKEDEVLKCEEIFKSEPVNNEEQAIKCDKTLETEVISIGDQTLTTEEISKSDQIVTSEEILCKDDTESESKEIARNTENVTNEKVSYDDQTLNIEETDKEELLSELPKNYENTNNEEKCLTEFFEVTIITESVSEIESEAEEDSQTERIPVKQIEIKVNPIQVDTLDVNNTISKANYFYYFADIEKRDAEMEAKKFAKFLKTYESKTSKLHVVNCDTYEENIIKEIATNFGYSEVVTFIKNGHFKLPNPSNIVKNIPLSHEIVLPIEKDYIKSPIFSPTKSECSFELIDYDAKLEETVNKKSRQEVMEIILGGMIEEISEEDSSKRKSDEDNLKRKCEEVESSNNNRSVLTPSKVRKLSESDQISSTTQETEDTPSNNNKVQSSGRSKYLGKARRVGLPRPRRCALVNSPSSDKSIENYVQNTPIPSPNGKMKHTPRSKIQRYDTSDLYKPKLHYLSRRNNIS